LTLPQPAKLPADAPPFTSVAQHVGDSRHAQRLWPHADFS